MLIFLDALNLRKYKNSQALKKNSVLTQPDTCPQAKKSVYTQTSHPSQKVTQNGSQRVEWEGREGGSRGREYMYTHS